MMPSAEKLTPDFTEGVDRKLLSKLRDRFLHINQARLARVKEVLPRRQQDIIDILPLLYQVNHPLIPGFVGHDVPYGVSGYEPDRVVLQLAKTYSQTFKFRPERRHEPAIQALFAMGSGGTLAHSESSDIDLWLCYDPTLDVQARVLLQQKAANIDAWALAQGLELHTFLMNAEAFRAGAEQSALGGESSGSAQHYMLLDEFYRTAILLAGRYPLWWLIPPDDETDYNSLSERLLSQRFVREKDVIDFGSACHVPLAELLGASLWQLYKSLDAPYKSVLKLLLSEAYAQELPHREVLSIEFKRLVYEGVLNVEALDPYLMIYRRLERYLNERGELRRLDLVRKSLYLKINKKLSQPPKGRQASWQRLLLLRIVADWGWSESRFALLDKRNDWKADQVLQERQELVAELTYSYRFISSYARMHNIASRMSSEDLSYLGRKLYATFQRKAGKVDRINPGIAPSLAEQSLAILHGSAAILQSGGEHWMLFRNLDSPAEASYQVPLKKTATLGELLSWMHYNGLYTKATRLSLMPGSTGLNLPMVQAALNALAQAFPVPLPLLPEEAFREVSRVEHILLIINLGIDPFAGHSELANYVVSDRSDALAYSVERRNLVSSIDQISLNSWQELFACQYRRGETLIQFLHAYLQLCAEQTARRPEVHVSCFSPSVAEIVARRLQQLVGDLYQVFFAPGRVFALRYVLEVSDHYYVLSYAEQQFRFTMLESEESLFRHLAKSTAAFSRIVLDRYALPRERMLRAVLKHAVAGQLQLYFLRQPAHWRVILVDELGNLLLRELALEDETSMVAGIWQYLLTVLGRQSLESTMALDAQPKLNCYQASLEEGKFVFKRYRSLPSVTVNAVVASSSPDGQHVDLSFDGREFTHYEYGERQCEALVHYLKHARHLGQRLPLKIVDAFVSDAARMTRGGGSQAVPLMELYFDLDQRLRNALLR